MDTKFIIDPIYENFFKLSDPVNTRAKRFRVITQSSSLTSKKDLSKNPVSEYVDVELVPSFGSGIYDVLWTTFPEILCISKKLADIFTNLDFTGWQCQSVIIKDPENVLPDEYYRFLITGPSYDLDSTRMILEDRPAPTPLGKPYQVYRGLFFDESKYDGSDFFFISNFIIITKRVKQALQKYHIRNIEITSLINVGIHKWIIDLIG